MSAYPTIPLAELTVDKANVRKANTGADPVLMASIKEHGILVPLIVRPNGKGHTIIDGGKRYACMKEMKFPSDFQVPVIINEKTDAREASLTVNVARVAMHPVDEHEAFAELHKGGKGLSVEEIAKRFALKPAEVRQRLALGVLAPPIIKAWREDELSEDEAMAFTLESDPARQIEIFNKHKKRSQGAYGIRRAIVGESQDSARFLKFVGADEYRAAGGKLIEDLFSDREQLIPVDMKLLTKLASDKFKERVEKLKAEGWKWVEDKADLGYTANMWEEDKKVSKEKSGCIVNLDHHGNFQVRKHVLKPADVRAAKPKSKFAKAKEPELSQALAQRLSQALTLAANYSIAKEPHTALAALVAGLQSWECCVKITLGKMDAEIDETDFGAALKTALKKTDKQLLEELAFLVGQSIDLTVHHAEDLPFTSKDDTGGGGFLLNALDQDELLDQIVEEFDLEDYFNSVSKDLLIAAIQEAINKDEARKIAGKTKGEIATFCIDNISAKNWLPVEMRPKGYKVRKAA